MILVSLGLVSLSMITSRFIYAAAAAKSHPSSPTLCDPIDGSPPGSPIPGILQARTLEWVAISFSNAGKWKVKVESLSRVRLLVIPWTAAYQGPLSMGFSRQEYWSEVPLPFPYAAANGIISFFFMAESYSILYICMYICTYIHTWIFFIHSSVSGHVICFHVLVSVNSAAMNIGVYEPFWITVFVFPRSGIVGSYDNF